MRQIYTSLDLGTNSVKLLVAEIFKDKFHILSVAESKCNGIKKGLIVNAEETIECVKTLVKGAEDSLNIKIEKLIVGIPLYNVEFIKGEGYTTISASREEQTFNGQDIERALQASAYNMVPNDKELVSIMPLEFIIDDENKVDDPKGLEGNKLSVVSVLGITPKKNVSSVIKVLGAVGLIVMDITFNPIADFYAFDVKDAGTCAIVNIGADKTEVSIMHKKVLINSSVIPLGGMNIDKDISSTYGIDLEKAKKIKENFACANVVNASVTDTENLLSIDKTEVKINQYELSELVYGRVREILEYAKKEINHLTKKQISYIIITGGLSEITDFKLTCEEVFGKVPIKSLKVMGVRNNKFSPCVGMIKYYHSKLKFRNKVSTMISEEDEEELVNTKKRKNNKFFGPIIDYFFYN